MRRKEREEMCARRGERTNRGGKRWYRKERKRRYREEKKIVGREEGWRRVVANQERKEGEKKSASEGREKEGEDDRLR